jgi:uncharacterized protein YbaR (Trm112 family)
VFIELIDDLRCPRPHEETWLVASAERAVERDIVEGTLGCPICHAEYPIRDGVVWFSDPSAPTGVSAAPASPADADLAMRVAAFLDLSEARGFALLTGAWAGAAPLLRGVVPTHLVVLNPATAVDTGGGISIVQATRGIPLADASCRGVALDDRHATAEFTAAAVRALMPHGRLIAPASTPPPSGITELARDDRLWVAERAPTTPQLVTLRTRGS